MSFEDWIFALHMLMAATLVGSLVMSWIVVVASLSAQTPGATLSLHRVGMVGTATTVVGLVGAIGFGILLAILHDDFQVWDGWVIAAIILSGSPARPRSCSREARRGCSGSATSRSCSSASPA